MTAFKQFSLNLASCSATGEKHFQPVGRDIAPEKDTIYQLHELAYLTQLLGYEGEMTGVELKQFGNFGVGAPYLLGELNVLDGDVYQALYDGTLIETDLSQTVPFAQLTHFKSDFSH